MASSLLLPMATCFAVPRLANQVANSQLFERVAQRSLQSPAGPAVAQLAPLLNMGLSIYKDNLWISYLAIFLIRQGQLDEAAYLSLFSVLPISLQVLREALVGIPCLEFLPQPSHQFLGFNHDNTPA